jgi:hypothetical protein
MYVIKTGVSFLKSCHILHTPARDQYGKSAQNIKHNFESSNIKIKYHAAKLNINEL